MSFSDIVLTVVGIALILVGGILFITGKQAGGKNKIEAFSIKMDVSNPSLVLIVFGILLLLAPRIMPESGNDKNFIDALDVNTNKTIPAEKVNNDTVATISKPDPSIVKPSLRVVLPPAIKGNYQLTSYIEDGETINAEGQLLISAARNGLYSFTGSLQAYVDWNDTVSYQYEGYLAFRGEKWFLKIDSATDPEWFDRGEVSMTLVNDGNSLAMKYYYGENIFVVWER